MTWKHSTNSYVASNLVWDTGIELRGDSWGNILENNHLRGLTALIDRVMAGE